eukprot:TRINITY_DN472_c0_g1_i1.p1 TRINITY_DN472_c0_g1~~TRINITY_DN472_c0_g1_i1.p1  ORF type:complete len:201 (-),score=68.31 TRINITY_DN472_c0_g1_i1:38-640(-)
MLGIVLYVIGLVLVVAKEDSKDLYAAELEELMKAYNSGPVHPQHHEHDHHRDRHKEEYFSSMEEDEEEENLEYEEFELEEDANKHVYGYGFGYGMNDGYSSGNGEEYGHAYDPNYNNAYMNNKPKKEEFDIHMDYMFLDYVTLLKYKLWLKKEIQMYNDKLHFVNLFVKMMKKREETAPFDPDEVEIKTYEEKQQNGAPL